MAIDTEIEPVKEKNDVVLTENSAELEEMFRAGVHFGYSRSRRHPKMAPFIYGIRNNVEVFDLEKVLESLRSAGDFLKKLGAAKKNIIFVGTKPSVKHIVKNVAKEIGALYVANRWVGGTLTNAQNILERLRYFDELKNKKVSGELLKYTKKEQLEISREIASLEETFSGIENLKDKVDAMVIVDPKEEKTAFSEATKIRLPVIAILSSDDDPSRVTFPIPANDTSPSSVGYILEYLARAYREGQTAVPAEDVAAEK
jgi:small subunit ribosomal protein S2